MRTKWVAGGLAVVAVAAGGTAWALHRGDKKTTTKAVATVAADVGAVTVAVATTGTVQPSDTRTLSFTLAGTVTSVKVSAGSKVKAGALLATIDATDATTAVDDAQTALDTAETQLTDAVNAAAKASASPSPSATTAKGKTGSGSGTSSGTGTSGGGSAGGSSSQSAGADAIFSAQERVNQDKVTLENAEDDLTGTKITAPIAGTIMSVAGTVGNSVSKGSTFISLADTYKMEVSASFPEADAGRLAVGQSAAVTLADRVGQTFTAKVIQVDPVGVSDGTLVTYGVLLSFVNAPSDLLSGQSAQVEVTTGSVASTLRVPSTAVHDVSGTNGTVEIYSGRAGTQRQVHIGLRGDQYTQITSGLTAGETVARSW